MTDSLRWTPEISDKRSRVMASMSYLGILCFVPLLFGREDDFISFHARQGLVLWAWGVLAIFSLAIPGLGWFFALSSSLITVVSLIGFVTALFLKAWRFPLIGGLADRL